MRANRRGLPRRPEPEEDEEQTFVELMLTRTVRVMRAATSFPMDLGVASGVIVERPGGLLVLTAGDIFRQPGSWTLEAKFPGHGEGLYVPLRDVQRLASLDLMAGRAPPIDLAWASIDPADVRDALAAHPTLAGQKAELPVYRGSLDGTPKEQAVYGYASWNRVDIHQPAALRATDASWETHMRFCGTRPSDGLYELALASARQPEDYYRGASGAPIADETGQIVSLVLDVDRDRNRLIGVPLALFGPVIGAAAPAPRTQA